MTTAVQPEKAFKASVPWALKIPLKLALARIPLPYGWWKRLGIFDHGPMQDISYAFNVFQSHYGAASVPANFTALELGPGDSLLSALFARAHGAARIYLVDAGNFASTDLPLYQQTARRLAAEGYPVPTDFSSVDEMLAACGAKYLTRGLEDLKNLPAGEVDLIWSQAVLEHVRRKEFAGMVREWRRILAPTGFASHSVDLKDHFERALNNLRFSDSVWESRLFQTSGFYTNRIRFQEMLGIFEAGGFSTTVTSTKKWPSLPTPRPKLAPRFRNLPDDDLLVSSFTVRLNPRT